MKKLFFSLLILLSIYNANSQSDSTNDKIRELLEVTGAGKLGIQMMNNMIAAYKKDMSYVPNDFWDEFTKEANPDDLIKLIIPIYAKYYTNEDITLLLQFYKSPIGQKVIEKLPLISQDSYEAGAKWGEEIGEKVVNRLKEKGYMNDN